jgi:hypothetical protein
LATLTATAPHAPTPRINCRDVPNALGFASAMVY